MASFSPIKLWDDDGDAGVYRAEGGREGTLPLLINESAASEARRPHSISPKCN